MRTCVTCEHFSFHATQNPMPDEETLWSNCGKGHWILTTHYTNVEDWDKSINNYRGMVGVNDFRSIVLVGITCDEYKEFAQEEEPCPTRLYIEFKNGTGS